MSNDVAVSEYGHHEAIVRITRPCGDRESGILGRIPLKRGPREKAWGGVEGEGRESGLLVWRSQHVEYSSACICR